jgi:hypothetical protein
MGWSEKYKKLIDCNNPKGFSQRAHCQGRKKRMNEAKDKNQDHEVAMLRSQLNGSKKDIDNILRKVGKKEKNLPAWIQAKSTDTSHNTDAIASYMGEGNRDGKSAKDPNYSLKDWFRGGGWVQAGGKYDGKPCAKQPGQKTKPFCRDADDRAAMSKDERNRRARKKRREDPNPNRRGKAKMISASFSNWRSELTEQLVPVTTAIPPKNYPASIYVDPTKDERTKKYIKNKGFKESNYEPENEIIEGKKDACYNKVKSRYSVWPSAYASGALVKCRKVGAANWGNKTKKEGYDVLENIDDPPAITNRFSYDNKNNPKGWYQQQSRVVRQQYNAGGGNSAMRKKGQTRQQVIDQGKKNLRKLDSFNVNVHPWKETDGTYVIPGGNTTIRVPPSKKNESFSNWRLELDEKLNLQKAEMGKVVKDFYKSDAPQFEGKSKEKRREMAVAAKLSAMREDWQKVNKSDKTDGMSPAAVKAYRRENPGSKLKTAVTGDPEPGSKDAKRRKSFCARSKGQQDMHNIDCSKTPDKPVCKARRRWKC